MMMSRLYLKGIGMMVGMMFGAGIFALPYTFSRAGLFWGILLFVIAFLIISFLHFLYGEIAYYTRGEHRFTGYVEIFLGKRAKHLAFITTILSYYGSLLIYGILGGLFLFNIFGNSSSFKFSVLFFLAAGALSFLNFEKIASINFYLTIPLFGFIIYLFFIGLSAIELENFNNARLVFNKDWFLPYGVWLFSLSGFAVIPEARDIFSKSKLSQFKKMIFSSLLLTVMFYFIFIFAVWGVSGKFTTPDALSGISDTLGRTAFVAGSLIGFLAVFTSFIALAIDGRNIFRYDYKISSILSWVFIVFPPIIFFLLGEIDFVKILSIVGALGMGIFGIFVILMARNMRKRIKDGDPGDLLKPDNNQYLKPTYLVEFVVLAGIFAGAIYELWQIFS